MPTGGSKAVAAERDRCNVHDLRRAPAPDSVFMEQRHQFGGGRALRWDADCSRYRHAHVPLQLVSGLPRCAQAHGTKWGATAVSETYRDRQSGGKRGATGCILLIVPKSPVAESADDLASRRPVACACTRSPCARGVANGMG